MAEEENKENTGENMTSDAGANETHASLGDILNGSMQEEVFDAIAFLDSKPEKKSGKGGKKDKDKQDSAGKRTGTSDSKKETENDKSVKEKSMAGKAKEDTPADKPNAGKKSPSEEKQPEDKPGNHPAAIKKEENKEKAEQKINEATQIADTKKSAQKKAAEPVKKTADAAHNGKKGDKPAATNDGKAVSGQASAGTVKNSAKTKTGITDKNGAKAKAPLYKASVWKVPGKKKSLVISILAFLLAGGAMFVLMTFQGAKDIKNTDAKMNFSYGNVIAGAVAPLFEALGITDDKSELEEATRKRVYDRSPEQFALNLADWTGEGAASAAGDDSSSSSGGGSEASGGRNHSASAPSSEPYRKMEAALGSSGFSGGGGRSQTSSNGMSSFEKGGASDAVNTGGEHSYASGSKLPVGKGKGVETLRASRQMLSTGLTSGSANIARSQWSSAFGEGRSTGKTSGFSNNKADLNTYNSGGLANLDKIKSGEITDLKTGSIDGKSGSITEASVPKMVGKANNGDGDENDKLIEKALGDVAGTATKAGVDAVTSGKDKDQEKGNGSSGKTETAGESGASTAGSFFVSGKPPAEFSNIAEKSDADGGLYCPDGCEGDGFTYKDNPATYLKTAKGDWVVSYTGEQKMDNGDIIKYEDKYVIRPGSDPEMTHLVSEGVNTKTGKKVTSYRKQL